LSFITQVVLRRKGGAGADGGLAGCQPNYSQFPSICIGAEVHPSICLYKVHGSQATAHGSRLVLSITLFLQKPEPSPKNHKNCGNLAMSPPSASSCHQSSQIISSPKSRIDSSRSVPAPVQILNTLLAPNPCNPAKALATHLCQCAALLRCAAAAALA